MAIGEGDSPPTVGSCELDRLAEIRAVLSLVVDGSKARAVLPRA